MHFVYLGSFFIDHFVHKVDVPKFIKNSISIGGILF